MSSLVISNVVPKETVRGVQSKTLKELRDILSCSFGPMGSNSCIKMDKGENQYSKDGHTILKHVMYNGVIEQSVKEDIESITRHITVTVGDGTTSAVILSQILFDSLAKYEKETNYSPFELIREFKTVVEDVKKEITKNAKATTPDDIYRIAMISTNGNDDISTNIKNIYTEYGMDVFIDVAISNSVDNMLKIYDGLTLDTGFCDSCFVNDPTNNSCTIVKPELYVFEDPVDTPEMVGLFDHIIATNIITPWNNHDMEHLVPTVIMAPKLSKDMSSLMTDLAQFLLQINVKQRPPICILANVYQNDELSDIAKLSGATMIKKYIDPKLQEADIARGSAPVIDTITTGGFCGHCDMVVSDSNKTKFINPAKMFNEDGTYSDMYNALLEFLETELKKAKDEGEDNSTIGRLKRRINSLKGRMVEYLVGGITMSDRDSLRDLVEDAVLNSRSAAKNGTGYAANYEGLRASYKLLNTYNDTIKNDLADIIFDAYRELVKSLYDTVFDNVTMDTIKTEIIANNGPKNLMTGNNDGTALSSIESDIIVLDTISKILSLVFTCNQFVVPTPSHNIYIDV